VTEKESNSKLSVYTRPILLYGG